MTADALSPLPVVLVALLLLVLMILVYKFLTRTRGMRVGKTRIGFFVERDPFVELDELGEPTQQFEAWPKEAE